MEIAVIRTFLMWCTIINGGLLILSFLICAYAGDWVYQVHSRWFPISKEAFNVAIYAGIGFMKMVIIVFNLVPYLALVIIG
jgi:hypothetical protein